VREFGWLGRLAVESVFGITDGLGADLASGASDDAGRAAAARHTPRNKHGRIVTGAAAGFPAAQWLTSQLVLQPVNET
jgi:hypothetical protein